MTPREVLKQARRIWPLDWRIDPGAADPAVIGAEHGALTVAIALTTPLMVVGTLADEEFFEVETDDLAGALVELERMFRRLVEVPDLTVS